MLKLKSSADYFLVSIFTESRKIT